MKMDQIITQVEGTTVFSLIGVLGFLAYVSGFLGVQLRLLDGNGIAYSLNCVLAASLVLISLTENFNLASALIQVSWIGIGLAGVAIRLRKRTRATLPVSVR